MNSKNLHQLNLSESGVSNFSPAIQALFIQLTCLMCVFLGSLLLAFFVTELPGVFIFLLVQSGLSAALTWYRGLDWWWCWIQCAFPWLIWLALLAQIPQVYYFSGFILLSLVYWSSFRTQVPYFPSKASLYEPILALLPVDKKIQFVDVGSGLGGLLMHLSDKRNDSNFTGIEIAPLPWLLSFIRGKIKRSRVNFIFDDYECLNFADFDVVFAYLSPSAMPALWQKASREMRPGCLLLSYEFLIPEITPDLCINIAAKEPILYGWRI